MSATIIGIFVAVAWVASYVVTTIYQRKTAERLDRETAAWLRIYSEANDDRR